MTEVTTPSGEAHRNTSHSTMLKSRIENYYQLALLGTCYAVISAMSLFTVLTIPNVGFAQSQKEITFVEDNQRHTMSYVLDQGEIESVLYQSRKSTIDIDLDNNSGTCSGPSYIVSILVIVD